MKKEQPPTNILSTPVDDDNDHYVIQAIDSGDIIKALAQDILNHNPNNNPADHQTTLPFPHIPWLKSSTRVTLYLADRMPHPKQAKSTIEIINGYSHQVAFPQMIQSF
jgi:hypothetical protein